MTDNGKPCVLCYNSINICKCQKVTMFTDITFPLEKLKNLMTYGLGGCYAGIIIYKFNGIDYIFMIHTPLIKTFLTSVKSHIDNFDIKYIKIKSPGEYINHNQEYIFSIKNKEIKEYIKNNNNKIIMEPYHCNDSSDKYNFNSMLGIKYENEKISVSNNYGVFEEINLFVK